MYEGRMIGQVQYRTYILVTLRDIIHYTFKPLKRTLLPRYPVKVCSLDALFGSWSLLDIRALQNN